MAAPAQLSVEVEVELGASVANARTEVKRLARATRSAIRALTELEEICRKYNIGLEVEFPSQETSHG
jgi:sugar phosphate isomerase/epimerase